MSCIDLPCDYDEWFEYKKLFLLLSHLRSLSDLDVFISSHTRADLAPSAISDVLVRLKGLVSYLSCECSPQEQNTFFKLTLPFIAREASFLDQRIPERGLPYLEKQENSALVLGRKVVLSILCNAFLCTFPAVPGGATAFTFEKFFDYCLGDKDDKEKKIRVSKLRCIICYFERAACGGCNLSGVITYRRQVLCKIEMPKLPEWESNSFPLCPFVVDDNNLIEDSGGHTLQVCPVSRTLGGGVLGTEPGQENIRFSICPELLISQLVMSSMDDNEAVLVTGTERFANYSGVGSSFQFTAEYKDESERDVFGNLLNSLVAMDSQIIPTDEQGNQYQPDSILRDLNKAYVGFYCQQDRGDINTDLIALTARKNSLAFVAEDYPEFCAPFTLGRGGGGGDATRQADIGNMHINSGENPISTDPASVQPLSPIIEVSESPNYSSMLATSILKSSIEQVMEKDPNSRPVRISGTGAELGGVDGLASKLASSIIFSERNEKLEEDLSADESFYTPEARSPDDLASSLATSILEGSLASVTPAPRPSRTSAVLRKEDLVAKSTNMARSIISDVLSFSKESAPSLPSPVLIVTEGEPSDSPREVVTLATQLSNNILCDVIRTTEATPISPPPHPSSPTGRPAQAEEQGSDATTTQDSSEADLLRRHTDALIEGTFREILSVVVRDTTEEGGGGDVTGKTLQGEQADEEGEKLEEAPVKKKQPFPFTRPGHLASAVVPTTTGGGGSGGGSHKLNTPTEYGSDLETPITINSRLLTPLSSRAGYAWSIASTRDEDSRPVSPTDLDHIALGLSKNSEEFSSLFSKIVISHAITNITGETLSPRGIASEGGRQDLTNLPGSSNKIGIFLSTLGEAEPPSDVDRVSSYNTSWHKMRTQLLRPIATGNWGCGCSSGDLQVKAMIQWMAASASGRPRLFYYTSREERMKKLSQVTSHLSALHWNVGHLCQALVAFTKQDPQKEGDLFTTLLQME